MAGALEEQKNVAANRWRHLIFFEEDALCYNYKTNQWTDIDAYDGYGLYSINSPTHVIGLVVFSSGSVDLQDQSTSDVEQTVLIETAATDFGNDNRGIVSGVRPIANGGTYSVRVGVQDNVGDSVSYSTATSVNSRTGKANFRSEGRYARVELTVTGDVTNITGADVDFTPQGRV